MCGRARASATFADIAFREHIPSSNIHDYWEEENIKEVYEPSCNVCPSRRLPIIVKRSQLDYSRFQDVHDEKDHTNSYREQDENMEDRILTSMRWGLIKQYLYNNKIKEGMYCIWINMYVSMYVIFYLHIK